MDHTLRAAAPPGAAAAGLPRVYACGNPDRGDDGIARQVIARLCRRLDLAPPPEDREGSPLPVGSVFEVVLCRQLLPEWALEAVACPRIVYLDAHATSERRRLICRRLQPPTGLPAGLSHVVSPEEFHALTALVGGRAPEAFVVSVRGHRFEAPGALSPESAALIDPAARALMRLVAPHSPRQQRRLTMASLGPAAPYVPGTYARKRPEAEKTAARYIRLWAERRRQGAPDREPVAPSAIPPCIAISRKIGVGALEAADLLGAKLRLRVADREILDCMVEQARLDRETVGFFDEVYPGKTVELSALLFGQKSFVMSDYLRSLANAVYALALTGPTIFVGRGTHLLLPRDRVLAVRLIASDAFRVKRLSALLKVDEAEAAAILRRHDREQRAFFRKAFDKKAAPASEFDLVVNCDFLGDPRAVADVAARAFRAKFPG